MKLIDKHAALLAAIATDYRLPAQLDWDRLNAIANLLEDESDETYTEVVERGQWTVWNPWGTVSDAWYRIRLLTEASVSSLAAEEVRDVARKALAVAHDGL